MDEHVGGYSTFYVTSKPLLDRALELLAMLREDLDHLDAEVGPRPCIEVLAQHSRHH